MSVDLNKLLFLCTGNYYRSRFAEFYFRHQGARSDLNWSVDSRGLDLSTNNVGPLSQFTEDECVRLNISHLPLRPPLALTLADLQSATLVVAVKEAEHRPLMSKLFPGWQDHVTYWNVHDLDCAQPQQTLSELRQLVDDLIQSLRTRFTKNPE